MIISYSKHGKSGGVDYAINNKTARVLEGDPKLTKSLIEQSKNKLKYRSGIISFEEKHPSKEVIQDVIAEFKRSTFPGLDEDQYNLLMVEHTNTDNYHIHFTIVRMELRSGKSFNPHWHQEDQKRLLKLQDYLNAKHGLTNPYQAAKRNTLEEIDLKALNRNQTKEEINKHIEELVIAQKLQNRDEVVQYFISSGIDVVRQSKNFITVQLDDERIRLKGEYYAETFKDIGAITAKLERAEREHIPTSQGQLNELKQELDRLVQHKAITNRERYPKIEQNYDREFGLRARDVKSEQVVQVHRDSNSKLIDRLNSNSLDSKDLSVQRGNNNHQSKASKSNLEGKVNDSIRENASRRARGREEIQQRTLSGTKAEPNGIYRRVAKNFSSIRERNKEDYTQLRAVTQRGTSEEQSLVREVFTERSNGIQHIKERVGAVVSKVKEFITERFQKAYKMLQEMKEKEANLKSLKEEKPKEQEQTHTQRRKQGYSLSR